MTALFPLAASIASAWESWARSLDALPAGLAYSPEDMEIALARPVPPGFVLSDGMPFGRTPGWVGDVVLVYGPPGTTGRDVAHEVVACGCCWCMKGRDRQHTTISGWRVRHFGSSKKGVAVGSRWWSELNGRLVRAAVVPDVEEVERWTAAGLPWDGPVHRPDPCHFLATPLLGAGTVHP